MNNQMNQQGYQQYQQPQQTYVNYNNNYSWNNRPTGYNTQAQPVQPQPMRQFLNSNQMEMMKKKPVSVNPKLTELEYCEGICTHKDKSGFAIKDIGNNKVRCSICGQEFSPVPLNATREDIQKACEMCNNVWHTIKLWWNSAPEVMKDIYVLTSFNKKAYEFFDIARKQFTDYRGQMQRNNNGGFYNNNNVDPTQMFGAILGSMGNMYGGWNPALNNGYYGQPQYQQPQQNYYQQQPQYQQPAPMQQNYGQPQPMNNNPIGYQERPLYQQSNPQQPQPNNQGYGFNNPMGQPQQPPQQQQTATVMTDVPIPGSAQPQQPQQNHPQQGTPSVNPNIKAPSGPSNIPIDNKPVVEKKFPG